MIELKGMTWDHPRGYQPLMACSEVYAKEHDVTITWSKRSLKDFGDQPIDQLTSEFDVLVIDHPHSGLAAATGALLALDEYLPESTRQTLAAQSAGASHESYFYEGHQWALALDAAMQTAVYRADLLDDMPQTWDDMLELGEKSRERNRYIAMPLVPTDAMCSFISLCASFGEALAGGDELVSREMGIRVLEMLRNIQKIAHPESTNWNPIHMLDHMSTYDDVVYSPLTFCYTNYSRENYQPKILTFTTIPDVKGSILGGTGFAVSSSCEHPQAACDFGAWLCSAGVQSGLYVREGGQPGNNVAWQDKNANALTNNFFKNTLPTLEHSHIRPRHHGFVTFQEQGGYIIHDFLVDNGDVDTCFDALAKLYRDNM